MQAGSLPIMVGGTGLYFKILTQGLARIPPIPSELRATIRSRLQSEGVAALYGDLRAQDPRTAERLMPADRARIVRALEVMLATGRSLADWQREGMARPPPLHQAAGHLVSASAAGLDLGRSRKRSRRDHARSATLTRLPAPCCGGRRHEAGGKQPPSGPNFQVEIELRKQDHAV